jgi:hypothetical protein
VRSFESAEVRWLHARRRRVVIAVAPLAVAASAFAFAWLAGDPFPTILALLIAILVGLIGLVTSATVLLGDVATRPVSGLLRADSGGVWWDGRLVAPRASLAGGFVVPVWQRAPLVQLQRRWPRRALRFEVPDEAAGRSLLQALGLDASQLAASFAVASRARADERAPFLTLLSFLFLLLGLPLLVAGWMRWDSAPLGALAAAGLLGTLGWVVALTTPTRVLVGADGILVSWLGRRQFLRYEDVDGVRTYAFGSTYGVALQLAAGGLFELPIQLGFTEAQTEERVALVARRIQQALEDHRAARGARMPSLPERGERDAGAWVRALRAVGSGANADHRTAPVARERLWRIVETPGADPIARVRAAVALGGGLEGEERARLRVAAEATAAPEVRGLLLMAAEEGTEDEVIGEALGRLVGR